MKAKIFRFSVQTGLLLTIPVFAGCIGMASLARPLSELISGPAGTGKINPVQALGLAFAARSTNSGGGSASETIGTDGGSLSVSGVTLDVPAGALESNQKIVMVLETSDTSTMPGYTPATPAIRLEPEGLHFRKPVKLSAPYGQQHSLSQLGEEILGVYYINEKTGKAERLETTREDGKLVASINHFSLYAGLYLSVEEVVRGDITDPVQITSIAGDLVNYVQNMPSGLFGIGNQARRNYFYALYAPTLLPFLNILAAQYAPATDPLLAAFPTDDFDGDGIANNVDPYPADPNNAGDVTPPVVVAATPAGPGISLAAGGNVTVTFDEPVSNVTLQNAVTLSDGNAVYALQFVSLDATNTIATYVYNYTLLSDTTYSIQVQGVRDLVNNQMAPIAVAASFHTQDLTVPRITSVSPNGTGVSLATGQVVIQFSEAMDSATLSGLSLIGPGSPGLTLSGMSPDNRTATFNFSPALQDSGVYFLQLSASIADLNGNTLAIPASTFWFQAVDTTAPLAYSIVPTGTHINPDTPPQLRVRFTEPVIPATVANIVGISGGTDPGLTFAGLDVYGNTALYNFDGPLDQETEYTVTVGGNYADTVGNVQSQVRAFTFKTADTIPPQVVSFTPTGGNVSYLAGVTVAVAFDEGIEEPTLPGALSVTHRVSGNPLTVNYSHYDPVTFTAFYQVPTGGFASYEDYDVAIAPTVTDDFANGVVGTLTSWFRTQTFSDPQLVTHAIDSCTSPDRFNVRLVYDRRMDASGLTAADGLWLQHHYRRYETRYYNNHHSCWTDQHTWVDPHPNLNTCVLAGCILNPGGCASGAILAACLITNPPHWVGGYTQNPCPVTGHYAYGDTMVVPFKHAINNDETLVFEVNHALQPSSNSEHYLYLYEYYDSTWYLPEMQDLDGKPVGRFWNFHYSPNLPAMGNSCP